MAIDPRIAEPGDPDLDLHLTGLCIDSLVVTRAADYDAECVLTFALGGAGGWWADASTGERVFPDRFTHASVTFGIQMQPGFAYLLDTVIETLEAWSADRSPLAMTCAPGKWTLLHCPGHPAGTVAVVPRGEVPALERGRR